MVMWRGEEVPTHTGVCIKRPFESCCVFFTVIFITLFYIVLLALTRHQTKWILTAGFSFHSLCLHVFGSISLQQAVHESGSCKYTCPLFAGACCECFIPTTGNEDEDEDLTEIKFRPKLNMCAAAMENKNKYTSPILNRCSSKGHGTTTTWEHGGKAVISTGTTSV